MEFDGEIVFGISDERPIDVDFGTDIVATDIVNKGDVLSARLGIIAPKYRWMYKIKYTGRNEFLEKLERMLDQLCDKKEYIDRLKKQYENVSICIDIRSDFGQIGYLLQGSIIKKMALLGCDVDFDILSFGMVLDE